MACTTGTLYYLKPGSNLYTEVYKSEPGTEKKKDFSNLERIETEVTVEDIRPKATDFSLARNGMKLMKLDVPDINWEDKSEVEKKYYPLVAELLKKETGATRVQVFDHTLRQGQVSAKREEDIPGKAARLPVGLVHVDYTTEGGVNRLHAVLPEEAKRLSRTPFAIVQVWRPLKKVEASPLGMIDAATVEKDDYMSFTIYFPGRTGYNYGLKQSPKHRWYYAKDMDIDEAWAFVCYDSRQGRARFTPHTGFKDHSSAPDAPPRESIELRSFCFFEDLPLQEVAKEL